MLQTEYVRNLNSNYERVLLDGKPEEQRYQYCILSRGGIKGLLSCSLRYINDLAYLYYDITSTQNVHQLYAARSISRHWIKDFLWNMKRLQRELERFLLDDRNVIWTPEQIFQDPEKNDFYFVYVPYSQEEGTFMNLLKFWVEHIDYNDEPLVECIYKMYEQFEKLGEDYLQAQIYEDASCIQETPEISTGSTQAVQNGRMGQLLEDNNVTEGIPQGGAYIGQTTRAAQIGRTEQIVRAAPPLSLNQISRADSAFGRDNTLQPDKEAIHIDEQKEQKKGIRYLFDSRKKRQKNQMEAYRQEMLGKVEGYAVSEETIYQEDYGRTVYIEEHETQETVRCLLNRDGKIAAEITKTPFVIGKRTGEVDLALEDSSVSRLHARILKEDEEVYLEDLNSTNGTFKNGLRMQPYEKRVLESGDEIRLGKIMLLYR